MSAPTLACHNEARRDEVRRSKLYGLDYAEVEPDHRTLTVTFLGKAPAALSKENLRVSGGRRITDIVVVDDPDIQRSDDPEDDDRMVVRVNKAGDFSTYTLRVVEADGRTPLADFDVRYAAVDVSFMADCPSELDCVQNTACPPSTRPAPEINYLARDYGSFRQLILDRLALVMPDWRERNPADIGIALVEALAYVGDRLSYFQDAIATEAYLATARQRISVRRHARLVDYHMHDGCNARVWVRVRVSGTAGVDLGRSHGLGFSMTTRLSYAHLSTKPVLRRSEIDGIDPSLYEVFEVIADSIRVEPALDEIDLYSWGNTECCLPAGSTRATLAAAYAALPLKPGDFLLFEEIVGPKTGNPADADPSHRHIVRLTQVTEGVDALTGTAVSEIEWAREDALPFPLCLSTIAAPESGCKPVPRVSVARGNIFLADHGRWRDGLTPDRVPLAQTRRCCEGPGRLSDPVTVPGRFAPALLFGPLTFREPPRKNAPAATLLRQDPRRCRPALVVKDSRDVVWTDQRDLLDSSPTDTHFVVEIDDDGIGHLRFGRDDAASTLVPGSTFGARYRVGIGRSGHIGADMLRHVVFDDGFVDGVTVSNPLAADGGIDPERSADVKRFAPHAFRSEMLRAITPEDYAALAQAPHEPRVQRAQARFLWTGSWYEVAVSIDPMADVPEKELDALARSVERHLRQYRRIGHDVRVRIARSVPLDLVLRVCVKPDFLRGHVEAALLDALSNRLLRDGRTGFFYPDNLTLGEGIAVSRIVAAAQSVEGVYSVEVERLRRKFEPAGNALEFGILRVQPWEMPRLDNDPSMPDNGTLKLKMRGGR